MQFRARQKVKAAEQARSTEQLVADNAELRSENDFLRLRLTQAEQPFRNGQQSFQDAQQPPSPADPAQPHSGAHSDCVRAASERIVRPVAPGTAPEEQVRAPVLRVWAGRTSCASAIAAAAVPGAQALVTLQQPAAPFKAVSVTQQPWPVLLAHGSRLTRRLLLCRSGSLHRGGKVRPRCWPCCHC